MPPDFEKPHRYSPPDPWTDVIIRPFKSSDAKECAQLLAHYSGEHATDVLARVSKWTSWSPETGFALVSERRAAVQGYGRANFLDPKSKQANAPTGWYLTGLVVSPDSRRHGIGDLLTRARLLRMAETQTEAWFFANAHNTVSIDLHKRLGFIFVTHDFSIPGVTFDGGTGSLFHMDLAKAGKSGT